MRRIYLFAAGSKGREGAAYAFAGEANDKVHEHWGFGCEEDICVMAVHALIRVLEFLHENDASPELEVVTNYAGVLPARIQSTREDERKRNQGRSVKPKNRVEIWSRLADLDAASRVAFGAWAAYQNPGLSSKLKKLARSKALEATTKDRGIVGVRVTDDSPLSWLL